VIRLVMRELRVVLAGILLGGFVAWGARSWLESLLFGLEPGDLGSLAAAAVVMLGVASLAAYLPARRASRVDPVVALRAG
jgi:ABC-type antimicrobial peptide transport system permease subunit